MSVVALIPCAKLWTQWRVTVSHAWHGMPVYSQPTKRWLAATVTLNVTSGTPPPCYTAEFPYSFAYNRYTGPGPSPTSPFDGNYPDEIVPNANCDFGGNPLTFSSRSAYLHTGDTPWEEWDLIWFNGATATVRAQLSSVVTSNTFRADWEALEAQASDEWDNPLMFDPSHSSAYFLAYDSDGDAEWTEDTLLGEPVSGCECTPDPIAPTTTYTNDSDGVYPTAVSFQTAFYRQIYKVNPLLQWSRKFQENSGSWTDVSCSNGSATKIERIEFPSPDVTYHTPGGSTFNLAERYLYTFGAQCP